MNNSLPIIKQNSKVALQKTKSLIAMADKILSNQKYGLVDEDWIQRLWNWADENSIRHLEWTKNELSDEWVIGLPRNRKELLRLTQLDLSNGYLTKLPKEIGKLTNLTYLFVSENKLDELPKEIGEISQLTWLYLFENHLTELPKEIGELTSLTELSLRDNRLTELPNEIGKLTDLTYLNLAYNELTRLPPEIVNLTKLVELDLDGNPNLILTTPQIKWIQDLIKKGCDILMNHEEKFYKLVQKLYDRDYDLGSCFERNISFEDFNISDNILTWSSMAESADKRLLITHWGLINMFIKDTFGFETKIVNIPLSKKYNKI